MSTRTIPGAAPAPQLTKKQAAAQRKAASPSSSAGPSLAHGKGDPAATVVDVQKKGKDDHSSGRPDKAAYDKEQDELRAQIDALQAKQNDLRTRISSSTLKGSPEHERKLAVRKELDALRAEQAARKGGRGKTLDQLKALQDAVGKKIKDLQAAKNKAPFKTVQEVENQIKSLERQVESGQMKLVDEKKALAEISSLRKQRKTIESFTAQQDAIDADKAKIDEVRKELDDPEHKALSDKLDGLRKELDELNRKMDEASKARDGLFEERNAVSQQIADLLTQKKASAAAYRDATNKYYQKLNDDRAKRDERRRAERKAAEEGKRAEINRQLLEEAQAPAFEREIEDCRTLILYFQQRIGLAPASSSSSSSNGSLFARAEVAGVPKLEIRKVDDGDKPKGKVLKKKGEEEEESWGGLAASKKGKKGSKKSPAPTAIPSEDAASGTATPSTAQQDEKLNLPFGTLTALMSLGITAPLTTSEVQVTIDSLNLKKRYFTDNQARVTKERVDAVEAKIRKAEEKAAKGSKGDDEGVDEVQAVANAEPTEVEEQVKDAQPQPIEEGGATTKEEAAKNAKGEGEATEEEVKENEKVEEEAAAKEGEEEENGEEEKEE